VTSLTETLLEWRKRDQDLRQNSKDYKAWLKAEIAARGWPVNVGEDAAAAAWLNSAALARPRVSTGLP
jgi:hypothetical protein